MDCFLGFIGFDGTVQAESGLYLTALPGITPDLLEGITDDAETIAKTFSDVENRSSLKFRTFFLNELNRCWNVSDVKSAECLICGHKELLSVAMWYLMGAEMMAETIGSERTNRFTTIDLDKAENLRNEYMDTFFRELHTAVAGVDLTVCIKDPEHGGDIEVMFNMP
ncbi:hypothetical protein [Proteiniphilum sp. X52]|uniref:hypothetical protein n=1 Tax=Proteiniphilum sp. X52 TaxID=2382159 RepID=UPI000F0A2176|nr:hypothetical protein [Proteiniphilum sp. X52]RNC66473.1 hypothetical protein D7D25_03055 [Proteiniphilum sp. X52]